MEDYKKKYEDALERAIKWTSQPTVWSSDDICQKIFPELKESEDERIRKDLIGYFKVCGNTTFAHHRVSDIIAWLEKQGEQKPVDKVEPKFKVGDWIINSEGMLRHILVVDKTGYQTDYGWLTHDIYNNTYHLWTIQDAKDGDVLANDTSIIIFRKLGNDAWNDVVDYYVGYNHNSGKIVIQSGKSHYGNVDTVTFKPATKEQRDLLFQKMKEAGYEWDAENKELKKIEQTYFQKQEWTGYDEKAYEIALLDIDKSPNITKNDTIDWLKSLKNRVQLQPKQEWSEEDEKIIKNLSNIIVANSKNNYLGHYYTPDLITKLQSLRHSRKLLNQEWSEEDEGMLDKAISTIRYALSIPFGKEDDPCFAGSSTISWLKSLKERVQPQLRQEWSEEDEMFIHGLIRGLTAKRDIHGHTTFSSDCIDITETINWLKSLKERYTWKPSDEQIGVISKIINSNTLDAYTLGILQHLYQDLIKMKEE